jgi:hypothetical protein
MGDLEGEIDTINLAFSADGILRLLEKREWGNKSERDLTFAANYLDDALVGSAYVRIYGSEGLLECQKEIRAYRILIAANPWLERLDKDEFEDAFDECITSLMALTERQEITEKMREELTRLFGGLKEYCSRVMCSSKGANGELRLVG